MTRVAAYWGYMSKSNHTKQPLRIIPIGGLGEIGKNMTCFAYGQEAILIDSGIMFPTHDMPGVDYILPDFRPLLNLDLQLRGILYTHAHEDHIGAVAHVLEAFPGTPLHATPLTAALLEGKLKNARPPRQASIHVFQAGDSIDIGPFRAESFHLTHSIPDCVGYGLHTPQGLVVHTGDYKFDNTPVDGKASDYARLASWGKEGVRLLLADSTNADTPGWTPSEKVVEAAFERLFHDAKGRIMVATFASVISRIQLVANAATRYGRKLAIAGRSMQSNVRRARELGILRIADSTLISLKEAKNYPPEKVVLMVTGSQGEPAAVLGRLAKGRHSQIVIQEGDTIIVSAHPIPGNEEMVYRTINNLIQRGAQVIYDKLEEVHVSGHACQEEMKLMLHLTKPEFFLPIHGELRHLSQHAKLAREAGIPEANIVTVENGCVLELDADGLRERERLPGGYVFVSGRGVGEIGPAILREREALARAGFFLLSAHVSAQTGELLGEPEIITRGFLYLRDAEDTLELVRETVVSVLANNAEQPLATRRKRLHEQIDHLLYQGTRRKPLIFCLLHEI